MLETALTLSAFLLLTFGVMEFSMAVLAYNFVNYSSRDAARYASVHGSQCHAPATADDIQNFVRQEAIGLPSSSVNVDTTWESPTHDPGTLVTVTVSYNVIPLVGLAIDHNLAVSGTSKMRIVH
jgi:Flp pilus assembly protein TadG